MFNVIRGSNAYVLMGCFLVHRVGKTVPKAQDECLAELDMDKEVCLQMLVRSPLVLCVLIVSPVVTAVPSVPEEVHGGSTCAEQGCCCSAVCVSAGEGLVTDSQF